MKNLFLKPDNRLLYQKAKSVSKKDITSKWFLKVLADMKRVAGVNQHRDQNKATMVGLAAPQIGHSYQVAFIDRAAQRGKRGAATDNLFMINPVITKYGKEKIKGREGCYSTKLTECDVCGLVSRSSYVTVKYMNLEGEMVTESFEGFSAVIAQHEVDHLSGKVFVHRIKDKRDLHIVFPSEYKEYKKKSDTWERGLPPRLYLKEIAKLEK